MTDSERSMDSRDKTTIGLTRTAKEIAERIKANEQLTDLLDVGVIGFGVAINAGVGVGSARETVTTWNVGTFDQGGRLRDVVMALYEDLDQPYRQIEFMVNLGLEILATEYDGAETTTSLVSVLARRA